MSARPAWLADLSPRERRLLALAAALVGTVAIGLGARAVGDDLGLLRARVAARERQLDEVRRLAAALRRRPVPAGQGAPSLLVRLEAAAEGVVGRGRIASMTPTSAPTEDGLVEERVALRVADASLAEAVRLLHALESAGPALRVTRLALRKHLDQPSRFDATLETAMLRSAS